MIVSLFPTISSKYSSHNFFFFLDKDGDYEVSEEEYSVWAKEMVVRNHYYAEFETRVTSSFLPTSLLSSADLDDINLGSMAGHVTDLVEEIISKDKIHLKRYIDYFHRYDIYYNHF